LLHLIAIQYKTPPRIYILHTLSKYPPSIDGIATPWDNRIIGFLGNVLGKKTTLTIVIPAMAFTAIHCLVYTEDCLALELPNLGNTDYFPRLGANAQDSTIIQMRYLMYLPLKYASYLLNNKGFTVKAVWNILYQAFQTDNILGPYAPILNWLRATFHATNVNNRGPLLTTVTVSPFVNQALLYGALPALQLSQEPGLNTAIIQMANAVATQATEAHTARLAREVECKQPNLPSLKFSSFFPVLKSLLNVGIKNNYQISGLSSLMSTKSIYHN
jgi:hypothetical protein